jgi:PHP family Zn ribbon phosphoesterase
LYNEVGRSLLSIWRIPARRVGYYLNIFCKYWKRQTINMGKIFNPEKYGMTFCPDCKGKGKLPKKAEGFNVCSRCGGSGVIKKEEEAPEEAGEKE